MADRLGWQFANAAVDPKRIFGFHSLVTTNRSFAVCVLTGNWRGVPIVAQQMQFESYGRFLDRTHTVTLVVVPRLYPGPECTVLTRGSWLDPRGRSRASGYPPFDNRFSVYTTRKKHAEEALVPALTGPLAGDPRMGNDRVLFLEKNDVSVLMPGDILQEAALREIADLAVDVVRTVSQPVQ